MKKGKFKIACFDGVKEVTGYHLELEGFPNDKFFVHRGKINRNDWTVSELKSGMCIPGSSDKKREGAILNSSLRMDEVKGKWEKLKAEGVKTLLNAKIEYPLNKPV